MLKQIYCQLGTTCNQFPLLKRKVVKKGLIQGGILLIIILIIFGFLIMKVHQFISPEFWNQYQITPFIFVIQTFLPIISLLILLSFVSFVYQILYYRYYFYNIESDKVTFRKRVIARNEASILYFKIQNVFVNQDFWDRILGLYDVHIATADIQSAPIAHIDGVSVQDAKTLKNMILERMKSAPKDTSI